MKKEEVKKVDVKDEEKSVEAPVPPNFSKYAYGLSFVGGKHHVIEFKFDPDTLQVENSALVVLTTDRRDEAHERLKINVAKKILRG